MNTTQLIRFLYWLYSPEAIQLDTIENIFARIIIAEIITGILAYLLRRHRPDAIQQLSDDIVVLVMEGRHSLAYMLIVTYTLFEEALFYGIPLWLARCLGMNRYLTVHIASQLWAIMHRYPGIIIPLIPMAILKASLWISGYGWLSTLWHIAHNTIIFIVLVRRI